MTLATGPDVAVYQKYFDPSKASDIIDFAIEKITDGINTHSALESMWLGVKQVWVRGAYHYQRSGVNWQAQADKFLAVAGQKDFHIYALDLEGANNIVNDSFLLDAQRIINYWMTKTSKRVILYTNIEYYKKLQALGLNSWLNTIPLWIASPNLKPGLPSLPPFRNDWTFHQYSWWGLPARWGTGGNTDENVYNGTLEQFKQWAGVTTPPPTGETMAIIGTAKSTTHNLTIRDIHQVAGSKSLGIVPMNVTVNVTEIWQAVNAVSGVTNAGDFWAFINYGTVSGWVGLKHLGATYGVYTAAPVVVPPVVPAGGDTVVTVTVNEVNKTVLTTVKWADGTAG